MTQRSEVYHEIGCGADAYWRCVFDKEYNRRLHLEAYKYESYELIEQEETDTEIKRVFTFKPKMTEMPKPLRKLMEGLADPSSTEECVFDKKAGRMSVLWKPKMLSERLFMKATVWVEYKSPKLIERIADLEVNVKGLPVVTWGLEKAIVMDIEKGWEIIPKFTHQFLAEKGWS